MAIVTTSQKGQVVIPRKEREKLGIKPGAKVVVEVVDDHVEIHPLPEDPVAYLCGIFEDHPASLTDALLKDRKEDLKREEKKFARLFRNPRSAQERG